MGDRIRHKGRFIKKKVLDKKNKVANALREKKKLNDLTANNNESNNLCEGFRIVDLKYLGKKLRCDQCKDVLCLDNIVDEKHLGLNSILKVKCTKCDIVSLVPTGKTHIAHNSNSKHSDINAGIVLGKFEKYLLFIYINLKI